MVSDQEIAKAVESLLRQTELQNSVTSINDVVHQLGEKLGLDLTHKTDFIRDQINLVLRSHPPPPQQPQPPPQQPQPPPQQQHHHHQFHHHHHGNHPTHKDHFALHSQPQHYPQQFPPHFALHPYHPHSAAPPSQPFPPQVHVHLPPPVAVAKPDSFSPNASSAVTSPRPKESTPTGTKRRGGPGGLNKVCGVSPELQAIVGEPALPRTEIVKQLWAYIRKNNLQDPSNKRKIICDDALRIVFETDCTDMFKMNKLLAKHIIALEPTKGSNQAKRVKVETVPAPENNDDSSSSVVISEALAKFFGTGGREMVKAEAIRRVWDYVKVNHLEDPLNSMVILCDAKLRELLGVDSISALGISEIVTHKHLFQRA